MQPTWERRERLGSRQDVDVGESLGATHIVDHALPIPELLAAVSAAASSAPVSFAYVAIRMEDTQRLAYAVLGDRGGFVSVMPRAGPEVLAPVQREGDGKPVARPFASFQMPPNQALGVGVDKRLTGWLADGTEEHADEEVAPTTEYAPGVEHCEQLPALTWSE
ncbi:uncharacterized protein BXZ73DRAFT_110071 [Epithele typhae]|uniref:uncharacterized protein n=1 Tax=Epithele typhae TaxID=378194 RepID=UPI00200847E9|nr:uncharacterized protein BXZ73DRAFT_110071 [Epithele typhae]KAH9907698.1 hypothetical protein BXZ73DRAFT_110071 [Epithele typhae]